MLCPLPRPWCHLVQRASLNSTPTPGLVITKEDCLTPLSYNTKHLLPWLLTSSPRMATMLGLLLLSQGEVHCLPQNRHLLETYANEGTRVPVSRLKWKTVPSKHRPEAFIKQINRSYYGQEYELTKWNFFRRFYLFLERAEGRETEREENISVWLPLTCPALGTWSTTQVYALAGNQTSNSLVGRLALNPLSHSS